MSDSDVFYDDPEDAAARIERLLDETDWPTDRTVILGGNVELSGVVYAPGEFELGLEIDEEFER